MLEDIAKIIEKAKNIAILPHISADGDCLGSAFALKLILARSGRNAAVLLEEENPVICGVLFGTEQNELPEYDTAIAVDCADEFRVGRRGEMFANCPVTVNIDHHPTNTRFAQHNYVDESAAAAGEIIFELSQHLKVPLNREIATNLYVAISSDTGCFSYSNATPKTYRIAARLLEQDINHSSINEILFEKKSMAKILLERDAFNSFETLMDGKIAMVSVTKQQILAAGATDEEASGLVSIPRSLDTAVVAVCLRESVSNGGVKVSLRSAFVDVSEIAARLGGGGHVRASGCTMEGNIQTVKQAVLCEIEKALVKV